MEPQLRSLFLCVLVLSNEVSSVSFWYTGNSYHNVWSLHSVLMRITLDSETAHLLQFYNFFSNESVQFAPTYLGLGVDLWNWRPLLEVLVLDCADSENVHACRDYNVSEVPTLRYFPPGYRWTPRYLGDEITARDPEGIKRSLLWSMANSTGSSVRLAAILAPLSLADNVKTIVKARRRPDHRPKYIVLVFQPEGSLIGVETILELSWIPYLIVRILENRRIFDNFGLNSTDQGLAIVDRAGNGLWLTPANATGRAYGHAVRQYLHWPEETQEPIEVESVAEYQAFRDSLILRKASGDPKRVFRADLERAIQSFIFVELPNRPAFAAENLTAIVQFFDVLRSMNPLNAYAQKMIIALRHAVKYGSNITGNVIAGTAAILERPRGKVFRAQQYIGCVSSRVSLRGYPCSLWTLFHYWTVGNARSNAFPPGTVLQLVHRFVEHLFTCPGCAEVYEDLVLRLGMDKVSTHDEEILWLWSAHNEINRQLAGKSSEDPMFPKIQFPSPKSCPECRDETGEWQKDQVLEYLKRLYDSDNLSLYGLPSYVGYTCGRFVKKFPWEQHRRKTFDESETEQHRYAALPLFPSNLSTDVLNLRIKPFQFKNICT